MNKLALSLAVGAATLLGVSAANAAPTQKAAPAPIAAEGTSTAGDTDMSSHRRRWHRHHWGHHHWHWGHRHWGHYPRYYRSYGYYRPVRYYRPAPIYPYSYYRPAPVFSIGFGFGPRFF